MKKLMTLLVALTLVSSAAVAALAVVDDQGPPEVKFETRMGDVTFQHSEHQKRVADCISCHHNKVEAGSCRSCHNEKPEVAKAKTVFHKLCKSCHKQNNGPTKCKECHVK